MDTYQKWATATLSTTRTPITCAGLLNHRVLPFFASQEKGHTHILTDPGTGYCGKLETHDYELYLGVNAIGHTRTASSADRWHLRRFHKTILQKFYQVAFRRKLYHSLEEVQADRDVLPDGPNTGLPPR